MRWLYYDPDDPTEAAAHEDTLRRIDRWWETFAGKRRDLDALFAGEARWDLPEWMHQTLHVVDKRLMWEFGRDARGQHQLVITPEGHHALRPMVRSLLDAAPELDGWTFHGHRQAEPWGEVVKAIEARVGGDVSQGRASARLGEDHRIDLAFHLPDCQGADDDRARHQAFVAAECLLGEETLDKWIGTIEVAPMDAADQPRGRRKHGATLPPGSLPGRVDALRNAVLDQLPAEPACVRGTAELQHALLELDPQPRETYPERFDLQTAVTSNLDMWRCAHSGRPFHSERFSRCGETFAYLKLSGRWDSPSQQFNARQRLHDLLDDGLMKRQVGCTIGGGTGLRYAYIDLALLDVRAAIGVIRRSLRTAGVGPRSWLLFFDGELADEWLGIHEDAPPPPCAL